MSVKIEKEGRDMNAREQILAIVEKNSRIAIKELAVILGMEEIDVANELKVSSVVIIR